MRRRWGFVPLLSPIHAYGGSLGAALGAGALAMLLASAVVAVPGGNSAHAAATCPTPLTTTDGPPTERVIGFEGDGTCDFDLTPPNGAQSLKEPAGLAFEIRANADPVPPNEDDATFFLSRGDNLTSAVVTIVSITPVAGLACISGTVTTARFIVVRANSSCTVVADATLTNGKIVRATVTLAYTENAPGTDTASISAATFTTAPSSPTASNFDTIATTVTVDSVVPAIPVAGVPYTVNFTVTAATATVGPPGSVSVSDGMGGACGPVTFVNADRGGFGAAAPGPAPGQSTSGSCMMTTAVDGAKTITATYTPPVGPPFSVGDQYLGSFGTLGITVDPAAVDLPPIADAVPGAALVYSPIVAGVPFVLDGSDSSDPEMRPLGFFWEIAPGGDPDSVVVSIVGETTATPTLSTMDVGLNTTVTLKLTVTDTPLLQTDMITTVITVLSANQKPDADFVGAPKITVPETTTVTLDGTPTTDDRDADADLSFQWSIVSDPSGAVAGPIVDANDITASFPTNNIVEDATVMVLLTVTDTGMLSDMVIFEVMVTAVDADPIVDAGPDRQVVVGNMLFLQGSATDPEGEAMTFAWTEVDAGGAPVAPTAGVTITGGTTLLPKITTIDGVTPVGTLFFKLTATDAAAPIARSGMDLMALEVLPLGAPLKPVAHAGSDQTIIVPTGTLVTLDGSASFDPGGGLTYAWTETTATAAPDALTTVAPTFTALAAPGTVTYSLVVTEIGVGGLASMNIETVTITFVDPAIQKPVAHAGSDQTIVVPTGALVALDGSASFDPPGGGALSYVWTETTATAAPDVLTTVAPTFPALAAPGTVTYSLVVTEAGGFSSMNTEEVTITFVAPSNLKPVAHAGSDQTIVVPTGTLVTLDGSASFDPPGGGALTYAWTETTATGAPDALTTVAPTFPALAAPGTVTYSLVVTEVGGVASMNTETVTITFVAPSNLKPVAHAGSDQTIFVPTGTPVTLDGSASIDPPGGGALSYAWTEDTATGAPDALTGVAPTFPAQPAGTSVTYSLVVTEAGGFASMNTETVTITFVVSGSVKPLAHAGSDQTIVVPTGTLVTLDGSGSFDPPGGGALSYAWTETTATAAPDALAGVAPTFPALAAGTSVTYSLVVTEAGGLSSMNTETVTISFVRDGSVVIHLTSTIIGGYLSRRMDAIMAAEPRLAEHLIYRTDPTVPVGFSLNAVGNEYSTTINVSFSTSLQRVAQASRVVGVGVGPTVDGLGIARTSGLRREGGQSGLDIWTEGSYSHYKDHTTETDSGIVFVGADFRFTEATLIGVVGEIDWGEDSTPTAQSSGTGWMVGPYFVGEILPNLFFDSRFAFGLSSNEVSPLGTYTDTFYTERWLVAGNLTGNYQTGNFRFSPAIGVRSMTEHQKSYVDSLGNAIPDRTASLGQLTFGPEFGYRIVEPNGTIYEPHLAVTGLYDFGRIPFDATAGSLSGLNQMRARIEAGIETRIPIGITYGARAFYDGIGAEDFGGYGIRANLSLSLN